MHDFVRVQAPERYKGGQVNLTGNVRYTVGIDGILNARPAHLRELINLGFWPAPVEEDEDGSSSSSNILGTFSYGDASPRKVGTIPAGSYTPTARIDLLQIFNGSGAGFSLGTLADPDLFMPQTSCSAYEVACYESSSSATVGSDTDVYLFVYPGAGASQGAGRYWLNII